MTILALLMSSSVSPGTSSRATVIAFDVAGQQDAQAIYDRDAWHDDQKSAQKCVLFDTRTAFTVCHAISIAITVVLPAPVAIFIARRSNSGWPVRWRPGRVPRYEHIALFRATSRQPNDGLDDLYLTEEGAHALKLITAPIIEEARRGERNAPCGRV